MIRPAFLLLTFLLSMSCAYTLGIDQKMEFETAEEMRIHVLLQDVAPGNLSLIWPFSRDIVLQEPVFGNEFDNATVVQGEEIQILLEAQNNQANAQFSFLIRFPCKAGENHIFPTPQCSMNVSSQALEVLLPDGWTAINYSEGCEKRYDLGSKIIRLIWENATRQNCEAVLMIPGTGERELRREMAWIILRGYIFVGTVIVLIILAGILLYKIVLGNLTG